ncbi:MAG TPA: Trp biosynthesis-associated membrane protein [Marmoricola sp.]|nr:Trp biosynthesis-associated membrane protein [Marmoricola sp.]
MKGRKSFVPVVLGGLAAAALAAVASSKAWAALDKTDSNQVASWVGSSGQLPLASALSLAALASWGALLVSRGRWRRWIALLGLAIALGSTVTAIVGYSKAPSDLRHAVASSVGTNVLRSSPGLTGWYWAALIADVLVVIALAFAVRDAPAWPAMSSRYDSPTGAKETQPQRARPETSLDVWKALDEGDDPTDTDA